MLIYCHFISKNIFWHDIRFICNIIFVFCIRSHLKPVAMLLKKWFLIFIISYIAHETNSQSGPYINGKFTWEGAFTDNKAVWNADDTLNLYNNVNGVDVKVWLKDPLKINTTTKNKSEFNDFTKTNTFFGWGSLAYQITSTTKKQAACLEFGFSKPIFLNKFAIWDIDMLQSSPVQASTYQDSIHVFASNVSGNVPLDIDALGTIPTFTIAGQQIKADFKPGVNGDVTYNDPNGAILISSSTPVEKFTICYANGFEDDGISNSHAIKIPEFEFAELVGLIEGTVFEDITNKPLGGSVIMLEDENGSPVYNKSGQLMEITTGSDGKYYFPYLTINKYKVVQINPTGYESVRDKDVINDNIIEVLLDAENYVSQNNDFFEKLASPLPVLLSEFGVKKIRENAYRVYWKAESEINNDFYEISLSEDGEKFLTESVIKGRNTPGFEYFFDIFDIKKSKVFVKLSQTDFDGRKSDLGIRELTDIRNTGEIIIFPNPVKDIFQIRWNEDQDSFSGFTISDINGKVVKRRDIGFFKGPLNIDIADIPDGTYTITFNQTGKPRSFIIIKQ